MMVIKKLLPFVLILFIGTIIYSNTFNAPFQFDGKEYILKNPSVRNFKDVTDTWQRGLGHRARFVTFVTFGLNYYFHQYQVFGYHVVNLAIHLINAILVWWFIRLTFLTPAIKEKKVCEHKDVIAVMAALLFLAHPLQTQAVTYITQRFASLATLFYVLSMCLYIKGRQGNKIFFLGCIVSTVLGMLTKEIVITLPFSILLYEWCFLRDESGQEKPRNMIPIKILIPVLCFFLIIPALYSFQIVGMLTKHGLSGSHQGDYLTAGTYFLTQFRVVATYIRLLFFPIGQNLDYDFSMSHALWEPSTLACFLFLLSIFVFALKVFPKYRMISYGIFWFFLTSHLVINIREII